MRSFIRKLLIRICGLMNIKICKCAGCDCKTGIIAKF